MQFLFKRRQSETISRCEIEPPIANLDREGLAIVLLAKNEGKYIDEWLDFHLAAGAKHIFLYDNGSTDDMVAIAKSKGDRVTVIPWKMRVFTLDRAQEFNSQVLAYSHAVENFGPDFRWMACIDSDEFLVPKSHDTLPACLSHLEAYRSISLPWHMFGRNGFETPPQGGTVDNFLRRHPDPMHPYEKVCNFKMIVDPCHVTTVAVHIFGTDGRLDSVNDAGFAATEKDRTRPEFYSAEHLQLNHYYTRSNADLQAKLERGQIVAMDDVAKHRERVLQKVKEVESEVVEDTVARDWFRKQKNPA